jgi:hypothetical protein
MGLGSSACSGQGRRSLLRFATSATASPIADPPPAIDRDQVDRAETGLRPLNGHRSPLRGLRRFGGYSLPGGTPTRLECFKTPFNGDVFRQGAGVAGKVTAEGARNAPPSAPAARAGSPVAAAFRELGCRIPYSRSAARDRQGSGRSRGNRPATVPGPQIATEAAPRAGGYPSTSQTEEAALSVLFAL